MLLADQNTPDEAAADDGPAAHGVTRRLAWIAGVTLLAIFAWSRSLLLTSKPVDANEYLRVVEAIGRLEHSGFSREVVVLRHFANYRTTDNWWNDYLDTIRAPRRTFRLSGHTYRLPFTRQSMTLSGP